MLDQFQLSFSRRSGNVAAGLASAMAFVTTKGRESFLSHMVPSVMEAQKRNLLSDPSSSRGISLRLPPSKQLDMRQGMCPYIKEHSLGLPRRLGRLRGGPSLRLRHPGDTLNLRLLLLHRSALSSLLFTAFLRPRRRARGVEVLREGYRILFSRRPQLSDQPLPMPSYSPSSMWGTALEQEFQDLLHIQAIGLAPRAPGFYGRLFVVQKDSGAWRPIIDLSTLDTYIALHGDSSVRLSLHSPGRLDDLIRSSGRMPPGSGPSGIASVSSLRHGRSLLSVQGAVLQVDDCPSGLCMADGSNIRHSPSLRYQDAQIPRRLADSSRIQDHLSPGEGQAPASVRGAGTTSQSQEVVLDSISGHDLSRHADPISSVHCKTDRDKGGESPQDHRGVSFIPGPPAALWHRLLGHLLSLTLLVKGRMLRIRSLHIRLRSRWDFRDELLRIPWDPLCQEDLFMVVVGDSIREGVGLSLPVPEFSFYLDASDVGWSAIVEGHQVSGVWTPSQREFSFNLRKMMAV